MSTEAAHQPDLGGQLLLEMSVLRTLCLTVNSDGSELKYRILDDLCEDDFYFPVTRTVFAAISELNRNGDQVVAQNLQNILDHRDVDVPDDFYVEDLFQGELASMATLAGWIEILKSAEKPDRPVDAVPEPVAVAAPAPEAPVVEDPEDVWPTRLPEAPPEVPEENDVLAPESGQWLGFLADLTKKQAERLKTGFPRFDSEWGGLLPGLVLLAGDDRDQLIDFLKQLVDQIAVDCRGPCLYLSFERSKATLRLQTLSRLSGASSAEIEKGAFSRDSAKWKDIVRAGERAVEWLQRIYVVEARPGLSVTRIRELRQGLLDSGAGAPRLVAVDNLDKLANEADLLHSVAELKELAETFGIVVVGVATEPGVVHRRSADMAATFHQENGKTVVSVSSGPAAKPTVFRFDHRSGTHRFDESSPPAA
jgi:DnaB-like helicase C terminal domain